MDSQDIVVLPQSCIRSLEALGYPGREGGAHNWWHLTSQKCQELVLWLEETKIRLLPSQNRAGLRLLNPSDAEKWRTHFSKYLKSLNVSVSPTFNWTTLNHRRNILCHLVALAIQDEYIDAKEDKLIQSADTSHAVERRASQDENDFVLDDKLYAALNTALERYQLPVLQNNQIPLSMMASILQALEHRLHHDEAAPTAPALELINVLSPACASKLEILKPACTVLRALHIENLEKLQVHINTILAGLQGVTGDPKTHTLIQ